MDSLNLNLLQDVVREWEAAPHGQRGAVLGQRLPVLGISLATFHAKRQRLLGIRSTRKPRLGKGEPKNPELRQKQQQWVKEIITLKYSRIKGVERLSTWNALETAIETGAVPLEAAEMSASTINKLAREMNLVEASRRSSRFEAAAPNDIHQVDATGSRHFFPYKTVGGEWILRLRPKCLPNKEKVQGLRVWCWGLVDDHSGFRVQRYIVSPGESALDGVEFLRWAWTPNPDHAPFEGLPGQLYMDNGVLAKYLPFKAFCQEVKVNLTTHEPYRPQATGKVETGNKDLKNEFEGRFMRDPGWRTREISLTELNQELAYFRQKTNQRDHRRLKLSKEAVWMQINTCGGPQRLTAESWEKIFSQNILRTLDDAACFDLAGVPYQVVGRKIWSTRVRVFQSLTSDVLVVEDLRDGTRYHAGPFVPMTAGDYCGAPKTELERAQEEHERSAGGDACATLERPSWRPGEDSNLLHLVKAGETRESSFEMPPQAAKPVAPASLEDIAAGMTVAQGAGARDQGLEEEPEIYASEVEWYEAMLRKQFRGEQLSEETLARMDEMRHNSRAVKLLGGDMERRARLAAVE